MFHLLDFIVGAKLFPTYYVSTQHNSVYVGIFINTDDEILKVNNGMLLLIHRFLGYQSGPIFALYINNRL